MGGARRGSLSDWIGRRGLGPAARLSQSLPLTCNRLAVFAVIFAVIALRRRRGAALKAAKLRLLSQVDIACQLAYHAFQPPRGDVGHNKSLGVQLGGLVT